ncbi:MAG: tRNA (adenosine(37)-N6)-threonylcarbamoyltransferase complex dimerization subunit type 1 TsaB [Acholeplasmatales bacterium]|nr:tRNA (adenosine(37)-N6)-threonylcarbamoyltransferase complex dimerization subunit type 1 TsaB [Acholeplasmatales bacterium]
MISLFIDTSLSDVSIALLKDNTILSLIHNNIPGEHSVYVTKYIEDILKENNTSPSKVNEIIVINGPGSFTGIRIGVTIAKVFAYLTKIRIVSITSLKARAIGRKSNYLLSMIDAKHNNYYVGLYNQEYETILEQFISKNKLEELKKEYEPLIVSEKDEYKIEEIIKYTKKIESINPHVVNPIYLKLPEAMEKK